MSGHSHDKPCCNSHQHQPPKEPRHDTDSALAAPRSSSSSSPSPAYHLVCLIGYSLSFIIFGSQVSILGPTIKPLAQRLQVDETDLSPLFTALGISCIISGTPSGWVVDRFPTHHVLIASLLVEAIGFSLVPYMPSVWSLTTLYFIICFSYNFTNSAVFTSLGWMFPKKAGGALNLVLAMFGLGSFFIPLAAHLSSLYLGSALAVFWLVGGLSAVSTLPFMFVTSPVKPAPEDQGSGLVLKHEPSKVLEAVTTSAVVLLVFFTTAAETSIGNWLFTFSSKEMDLSDSDASLANAMFWGAFTVGRVFGVLISPFTTPSVLLLGSTPFCIAGAAIPLLMRGSMTWNWVMATALLTGFGNSTGYANAVALLEQYLPVTGFVNGVFGAVAGAACMIGPTLVAMLAKYTSLGYYSMAWVGLFFYVMHVPTILTAMTAGGTILAAAQKAAVTAALDPEAAEAAGNGLKEPLLAPEDHVPGLGLSNHGSGRLSLDAAGHGHGSYPVKIDRSYSQDISQPRVSLPGHFGSYGTSAQRPGGTTLGAAAAGTSPAQ